MNKRILVRVVAPHFVAGYESDGVVRRAAPILYRTLYGKTDREAAKIIAAHGWKADMVKARRKGWSEFFWFDD